ncbi:putative glycolipid-binding domain-containing protein [Paraburkholderia sp.]|uniref:putative glycolipid-binding domain-containing protein n=1 Tax=Paraburkholderia sp. TaxID=1926495 RepID=UPI0023876EA5|nr:putative glycolipid-binding domain-containing protein [Paraburkholderia sp.]MDE1181760.1 putative glycolipid-binding domain-containing protein [Paraburkholderia sp.]
MREVSWTSLDDGGIEHLALDIRDDGVFVESVVVAQHYGLHYRLRCDAKWHVRYAYLKTMGGATLELHADGDGTWRDGHGLHLGMLDGCIDIDIMATPFTNTLPIRRLTLAEGERRTLSAAYIATPDLRIARFEQAYTCIELDREYRYEGLTTNFAAHLSVDDDGLVIDYPAYFRRLRRGE